MPPNARTAKTRERLVMATLDVIRDAGLAEVSARSVAARADVNQALIFYHFGTLSALVVEAYEVSVADAIACYETALRPATSVGDVLDVMQTQLLDEGARGDVALMAQLMAQAQHDDALAETARSALAAWHVLVGGVLDRVLGGSVAATLIDQDAAAHLVVASMLGAALVGGLDPASIDAATSSLRDLDRMAAALDRLPGPVRRAAVAAMTHATR